MTMYVIKTEIKETQAQRWSFDRQKTMYGGKCIAKGDTVFIFASENEGGSGLVAKERKVIQGIQHGWSFTDCQPSPSIYRERKYASDPTSERNGYGHGSGHG